MGVCTDYRLRGTLTSAPHMGKYGHHVAVCTKRHSCVRANVSNRCTSPGSQLVERAICGIFSCTERVEE
jgi:hypothetical protein